MSNRKVTMLFDAMQSLKFSAPPSEVIYDDPSVVLPPLPVIDEAGLRELNDRILNEEATVHQLVSKTYLLYCSLNWI